MQSYNQLPFSEPPLVQSQEEKPRYFLYLLQVVLFLASFVTTTLAGVLWVNKNPLELSNFIYGLPYSLALLAILTAHEFGHYFAAKYHGVKTTYPFFIPFPPFIVLPFTSPMQIVQLNPFGTMGAVIRIQSPLYTRRSLFDIGIAGPLAGLVVTIFVLIYGLATLPPKSFLLAIHPDYQFADDIHRGGLTFGHSILTWGLWKIVPSEPYLPPMTEMYHYPMLCVGWFGLFITAMNLLPVGQLDGGHILYAIMGKWQGMVARVFFALLLILGFGGIIPGLQTGIPPEGAGWLLWAAILLFIIKLDHPPVTDPLPLDAGRSLLGWITFILFIISFVPIPIYEAP